MASVFRPGLFAGKVAVVTGGGTGLGKAISKELASLGCKVVITARNEERLLDAQRELSSTVSGADISVIPCNIRKEDQVHNLMAKTLEKYKRIDFLVNNGGGQFVSPAADIRAKGWSAVVETNLTGTFMCCKEAYNQYMQDNGGCIVNIIMMLNSGNPGMAHSGAARAGVEAFTKTTSIEWASSGVRVNCVAPGVVFTDSAAKYYAANGHEDIFEKQRAAIPFKRVGTADEVASCVTWLLSPGSAYVSGETISVDGALRFVPYNWIVPDHDAMPKYEWDPTGKSKL